MQAETPVRHESKGWFENTCCMHNCWQTPEFCTLCFLRFASPRGIFGEHYHNSLDASQPALPLNTHNWEQWHVSRNYMLSTESQGQMWGVQFTDVINSNVMWLPENSLPRESFNTTLESVACPILLILEGPIFGPSGIAQVSFGHAGFMCLHFHYFSDEGLYNLIKSSKWSLIHWGWMIYLGVLVVWISCCKSTVKEQVNRRYWLQLSRTFKTTRGLQKFLVMLEPQVGSSDQDLPVMQGGMRYHQGITIHTVCQLTQMQRVEIPTRYSVQSWT